jgi:hypothetical protein
VHPRTDRQQNFNQKPCIHPKCNGFHHIRDCPRTDCNRCGRNFSTVQERQQHYFDNHLPDRKTGKDYGKQVPRKHSSKSPVPMKESRSNKNPNARGTKRSFDSNSSDPHRKQKFKAYKAIMDGFQQLIQESENESEHQNDIDDDDDDRPF